MATEEIADQHLECAGCGDGFVYSAGEQELHRLRGLDAQPDHCPQCVRSGLARSPRRDGRGSGQ